MGTYASVRGWLACSQDMIAPLRAVLGETDALAARHHLSREQVALYMRGWHLPDDWINWTYYAFYGADIRVHAVDMFKDQLAHIARRVYDFDDVLKQYDYVEGSFHIDHEDGGATIILTIGAGRVVETAEERGSGVNTA